MGQRGEGMEGIERIEWIEGSQHMTDISQSAALSGTILTPVRVPVLEHSVLAAREEVVGLGLEPYARYAVLVSYQRPARVCMSVCV